MKMTNCPHCNSNNWIIFMTCGNLPSDLGYYVKCLDCGVTTEIFNKENKAKIAWSTGEVKNGVV